MITIEIYQVFWNQNILIQDSPGYRVLDNLCNQALYTIYYIKIVLLVDTCIPNVKVKDYNKVNRTVKP